MTESSSKEASEEELLAGYALGDCSDEEIVIVNRLLEDAGRRELLAQLESTAAAMQLAFYSDSESEDLPNEIRRKVFSDAGSYVRNANQEENSDAENNGIVDTAVAGSVSVVGSSKTRAASDAGTDRSHSQFMSRREMVAWAVCAAAIFIAVGVGLYRPTPNELTLVEKRDQLLSTVDTAIVAEWGDGKTRFESKVTGDVVWDNDSQTGFLRFVGMPQNNPAESQYQLWIIDPDRDDEPIDGGVFDIGSEGEIIVEIDAKLRVVNPQAFAITIEKPGGVVVSTQNQLPLLATVN